MKYLREKNSNKTIKTFRNNLKINLTFISKLTWEAMLPFFIELIKHVAINFCRLILIEDLCYKMDLINKTCK